MAVNWQQRLVAEHPERVPVTAETWKRLSDETRRFYRLRGTAPTELAARVLLNDFIRQATAGSVAYQRAIGLPVRKRPGGRTQLPSPVVQMSA